MSQTTERRTARRLIGPALVLGLGLTLGGCQSVGDGYPSPYGPSRPTPLPAVAGGGLWNPTPLRTSGYGSATLINRLPQPDLVAPPPRSAETPELLTPQQELARRQALEAEGRNHVAAMNRRLQTRGRVRGPDPGSRPAIESPADGD
ncbi:hypothetical protein [Phreatobacter sp.]|uniref:hypothetical protein n=1 Tax=Phreatobacter sp. TaxID=1966341 RepID=UPI003F707C1C